MKLLLVAATLSELALVFDHFELTKSDFVVHEKFDILITGIGMTATAFALGKYLSDKYSLVLNVGIAGSFDKEIPLGTLLNIETDTFSELGAEDFDSFLTINDLGFGNNSYASTFPFFDLQNVNGITVNTVHGNAKSIQVIKERFDAKTESMEGAAVFYACQKDDIKCLQVRAISNYVEPRNKSSWEVNLAIKNLTDWVIGFIDNHQF